MVPLVLYLQHKDYSAHPVHVRISKCGTFICIHRNIYAVTNFNAFIYAFGSN